MTRDTAPQIAAWLRSWFARRAPEIELQPQDNYFDCGAIDSFDVIVLIEEVETRYAIRFVENDFQDRRFATIEGLAAMILQKVSSAPG